MILCHPLRIVFLKTRKVGGTSFEIALSAFCGPDCIVTPISAEDEQLRGSLGFRGAQNHRAETRPGTDVPGHPNAGVRGDFGNHIVAAKVRAQIPSEIWNGYLKLSIHRDPLDMLVSQYFFRKAGRAGAMPSFAEWFALNRANAFDNARIAPVRGPDACDVILSYETLQADIAGLSRLPPEFLPLFRSLGAKSGYRDPASRDARAFFRQQGLEAEIAPLLAEAGRT